MYKHEIKITVRRPGEEPISIAQFKKLSWIKKLAFRWFDHVEKLMVIVPEDSIQKIEVKEV